MSCQQQNASCGGLSNYGGYGAPQYQQQPAGLASYGQSFSSENLDFNNLPPAFPQQQPQYQQYSAYQQQYQPQYQQQPQYSYPQQQQQQQQQIDVNDPQLLQQIEQIVASLSEQRRPMLRRQVITVPAQCPGRVANISRRLPTPPPDIIERITVIKPPRDVINLCIEKPCQPGPCFQEKTVCGKPRKPLIQPRVVQVPPRSNPCCPPPPPPPPPQPQVQCCPPPPPPPQVCCPPPPPPPVQCCPPPPPQPQCCPPPPPPVCCPPPPPPPQVCCPPPPPPPCCPPNYFPPQQQQQQSFGGFGGFGQSQFGGFGGAQGFGGGCF